MTKKTVLEQLLEIEVYAQRYLTNELIDVATDPIINEFSGIFPYLVFITM